MRNPTKDIVAVALSCLLIACGGGGPEISPIAAVASVTIAVAIDSLLVGQTRALLAQPRNENGQIMNGRDVAWATSNATVATVTPTGTATAVAPGTATITAVVEGKLGSVRITVLAFASCTASEKVALGVSEVRVLTAVQKNRLCVEGGASGGEFAVIASAYGAPGAITLSALNAVAVQPPVPTALTAKAIVSSHVTSNTNDWHLLARPERSDLLLLDRASTMRSRLRAPTHTRAASASPPNVGDIVQLNTGIGTGQCTDAVTTSGARVVSVLRHFVVYVDLASPAGGFTDADFISIATEFDTLGFAIDTINFSAPPDVDANGRVNILFSPAVNAVGAAGVVINRDFFDRSVCPPSNGGEIMYLAVPDAGPAAPAYSSREQMLLTTPYVLAHEFAHIINVGRDPKLELESKWLHEGLSTIASELYFYARSGIQPLQNFSGGLPTDATHAQFLGFTTTLSFYFQSITSPNNSSPFTLANPKPGYGPNWHFLRYLADRRGGNQTETWRALAYSGLKGITSLEEIFGDVSAASRDWAVAQFLDDLLPNVPQAYSFPSWNFRRMLGINQPYPLQTLVLNATPLRTTMANGGAAYFLFGAAAGQTAYITAAPNGVVPVATLMVVRTR